MKLFIVFIIFTLLIIFLYKNSIKEEINYTILGEKNLFSNNLKSKNFSDLLFDELIKEKKFGFYSKDFIDNDIRIVDLINYINNNKTTNEITIQNILKRTNLLLLNIGNNEINYKLSKVDEYTNENDIYNYLDEVSTDLFKLIDLIKKYNSDNIILMGYYNDTSNIQNDKYYKYINNKVKEFCKANNIYYTDLFSLLNKNEDYLTKTNPIYITNEGNLAIFDKLYSKIDCLYLHKVN